MRCFVTSQMLFKNNQKLANFILHKHFPAYAFDEDMQQEAYIGLWQACTTYDKNTSAFSTYASACIYNQICAALRKINKEQLNFVVSENATTDDGKVVSIFDIENLDNIYISVESSVILKEYIQSLSDRDRIVFGLLSNGGKQRDMERACNVSHYTISKSVTRIKKALKQLFVK